ncbi:hypothetical protein [Natrarchaeobaculum aegyptiacum]|uniref:Uncharacterized protein n=1 Tax=Natrarchaeobaculum aegyptiacum TaxID=745377 RepID=A0A2Z2HY23_9EURY|nr:hypothetical protein [Natrarchaeobaculum aegyptiacum]ARS89924.1 hypothetical protein B1756_09410 [Natrarchaeobaculum aegyptiacum]
MIPSDDDAEDVVERASSAWTDAGEDGSSWFVDDRDRQATLDVGDEAARTRGRSRRDSSLEGSAAFVDDSADRRGRTESEQTGLFAVEEELEEQADLFGDVARVQEEPDWMEPGAGTADVFADVYDPGPSPADYGEWDYLDVNGGHDEREFLGTGLAPDDFEEPAASRSRYASDLDSFDADPMEDLIAEDLASVHDRDEIEDNLEAAAAAGVLEPSGPNGDSEHAPDDLFDRPQRTETIEFGSRDAARRARAELDDGALVTDRYDGRHRTIEIDVDEVDDRSLDRVVGMAADSRAHEAEQHGQLELTESERERIDFSETNVPHAQAVKGVLTGEGITDWLAIYDPTLSVDEHRSIADRARRDDRGDRLDHDDTEAARLGRMARAHHRVMDEECDHARSGCEDGHEAACRVLKEDCDMDESEVEALRRQVETGEISEQEFRRRVAVEIERSTASGQMVSTDTVQTRFPPGERSARSGLFVPSPENRTDPGIMRDRETGQFTPEDNP